MRTFKEMDNPFTVQTPEGMEASQAVELFVDVFTDFPKIPYVGHLFLHAPRGCGKSMIFRFLEPDCQCLVKKVQSNKLPFYSILVPIKRTHFNRTELQRLEGKHASVLINEHFMVIYIAELVFEALNKIANLHTKSNAPKGLKTFMNDFFLNLLASCGWDARCPIKKVKSEIDYISIMKDICASLRADTTNYMRKLSFPDKEVVPYQGPLCNYLDFLYPMLCGLKRISFVPDSPIYLLIDDADYLSTTQTQILNTWVSSRTSTEVSIKISTQLRYKTYRTIIGQAIQTPHDFSEVNISTTYTASPIKSKYKKRMTEIVAKRLKKKADINIPPHKFFPEDNEQEEKIKKIAEEYKGKWENSGRGYRPNDDAYRYARPEYIKRLGGAKKSTYNYRYAGFEQLVHVSSGIVRNFLDAAAEMFGEMQSGKPNDKARFIPSTIQDEVVRKKADEFLFNEFEKLRDDRSSSALAPDDISKLYNLIQALGGAFYEILVSDRSERRVFSIAISGSLNDESVRNVLRLGTELGYFQKSSIGNKDGTGRTPLYIMSRMLAPHFKLDPTSFAGYLFVTENHIRMAMSNPKKFIVDRLKIEEDDSKQIGLF